MNPETTNFGQVNGSVGQVTGMSKKCKHMPLIVALVILAIAGLGFGGFEFWQNMQKDSTIEMLQANNDKLKQQLEKIVERDENGDKEDSDEESNQGDEENVDVSQYEYRIVISDSGKVCVANMTKNTITTCAEDVAEYSVRSFSSCDGNSEILNCMVTTVDGKSAKFIYNINENTFTHGRFGE